MEQPLFQSIVQFRHYFSEAIPVPKGMGQSLLSQFELKQSDLKIRPKCQMSTCIQSRTLISKDKILKVNPNKKPRDLQAQIQEKDSFKGSARETASSGGCLTCLLTSPGAFGALLWSSQGPPKCWPNTDCQLFLQQTKRRKLGEGGCLGSADSCNSGPCEPVC